MCDVYALQIVHSLYISGIDLLNRLDLLFLNGGGKFNNLLFVFLEKELTFFTAWEI